MWTGHAERDQIRDQPSIMENKRQGGRTWQFTNIKQNQLLDIRKDDHPRLWEKNTNEMTMWYDISCIRLANIKKKKKVWQALELGLGRRSSPVLSMKRNSGNLSRGQLIVLSICRQQIPFDSVSSTSRNVPNIYPDTCAKRLMHKVVHCLNYSRWEAA
jgi:hypothetical protein